jgi:molybdopterin-guanine dinucleotide biosynthesis protein A
VSTASPVLVVLAAGRARRYGGCKPLAPVGPAGEPVLDVLASDALAAGFSRLVLVLSPSSGPAIRYRVERAWPPYVEVHLAEQPVPRGTVDAVLAASEHLAPGEPFGVANADDIYGRSALAQLARHLAGAPVEQALVAFTLEHSVVSEAPVTRGICSVDADGWLTDLAERRQVHPVADGWFAADDGLEPAQLGADERVSVNLWGFTATMLDSMRQAMAAAGGGSVDAEVLLPEMVGRLVSERAADPARRVRVLPTDDACIGVTHPSDLELVQAELAHQVASGRRPAALWSEVGDLIAER